MQLQTPNHHCVSFKFNEYYPYKILIATINIPEYKILYIVQLSDTEQPIHLSRALIMTSGRNLWAVDTNSWNWHLLRRTKRNIVTFNVNVNESIPWIEQNSSVVSWLNDNSSFPYSKKLEAQAMAVDYITDKLYIIDEEAGTLNVIDMRYNYTGVVLSDLANPHDIVLDSLVGLVFIVQLNNSVMNILSVLK